MRVGEVYKTAAVCVAALNMSVCKGVYGWRRMKNLISYTVIFVKFSVLWQKMDMTDKQTARRPTK